MNSKTILNILLTILCGIIATGCSTTSNKSKKLGKQLHSQLSVQAKAIKESIPNDPSQRTAAIHQLETKVALVEDLQNDFDTERALIEDKLNELTGNANAWGYEGIGIKRAGLLSGIAAAALVAASPANMVWVAGFSGFAGAANGYAAASGAEGFSKAAVAAFLKPVVQKVNTIAESFTTEEAQLYLWKDSDNEKFQTAVSKQRLIINRLTSARMELLQPVTAVEPELKHKEEMISEIKKRDEIIEDLRQQIKKTPGQ
jgi:hypothetical protein